MVLCSKFYGDPAEHLDEWRALRARAEQAEKEAQARRRRNKARRIRKLTRQAM